MNGNLRTMADAPRDKRALWRRILDEQEASLAAVSALETLARKPVRIAPGRKRAMRTPAGAKSSSQRQRRPGKPAISRRRANWTTVKGVKIAERPSWYTPAVRRRYRARVKVWLKSNRVCVACAENYLFRPHPEGVAMVIAPARATQCHHKHGRGWRGELLMVESLWLPICDTCQTWIHANIEFARALGLYAPKGQWNKLP